MSKSDLIQSANLLPQISENAAQEYISKSDILIACINKIMMEHPKLNLLIGNNKVEMMKINHKNHLEFIASIMTNFNANVLVETIIWVFKAYQNHGFSSEYWSVQLNAWQQVLEENISKKHCLEIIPIYHWMQSNINDFCELSK